MRNLKTYLFVAPVLSTLWFGSLAGQSFIPGCVSLLFLLGSSLMRIIFYD